MRGAWVGIESEHTGFREVRIRCPVKFAQYTEGAHASFTHATIVVFVVLVISRVARLATELQMPKRKHDKWAM